MGALRSIMALSESDIPEGVRDIFSYMPADIRRRVLVDYDHYAPFLGMLQGWMAAIKVHSAYAESAALDRLEDQFFPLGKWNFPSQGLACPQRPMQRAMELLPTTAFTDAAGRGWLSCGDGWIQPTSLTAVGLSTDADTNRFRCSVEIQHLGDEPLTALLHKGQLAYVAAEERVLLAMASATWWVQTADGVIRPAQFLRYDGYMSFEREIGI